jgi:hypothetical protein
MNEEEQPSAARQTSQRSPRRPLFRRYKWDELTEPEKDGVRDALGIVGIRAAVGVGLVATVAAGIAGGKSVFFRENTLCIDMFEGRDRRNLDDH